MGEGPRRRKKADWEANKEGDVNNSACLQILLFFPGGQQYDDVIRRSLEKKSRGINTI